MIQIGNKNNLIVIFTDNADAIFYEIMNKYHLKETDSQGLDKLIAGKFSNEVILDHQIKYLLKKEISFDEFIKSLEEKLDIQSQVAKNLAKDIKENLLLLIDLVPEDQLEKYNKEKEEQKRYSASGVDTKNFSYVKKPEITDVEENAEASAKDKKYTDEFKQSKQSIEEELKVEPVEKIKETHPHESLLEEILEEKENALGKNRFVEEKREPDSYREQIEEDQKE